MARTRQLMVTPARAGKKSPVVVVAPEGALDDFVAAGNDSVAEVDEFGIGELFDEHDAHGAPLEERTPPPPSSPLQQGEVLGGDFTQHDFLSSPPVAAVTPVAPIALSRLGLGNHPPPMKAPVNVAHKRKAVEREEEEVERPTKIAKAAAAPEEEEENLFGEDEEATTPAGALIDEMLEHIKAVLHSTAELTATPVLALSARDAVRLTKDELWEEGEAILDRPIGARFYTKTSADKWAAEITAELNKDSKYPTELRIPFYGKNLYVAHPRATADALAAMVALWAEWKAAGAPVPPAFMDGFGRAVDALARRCDEVLRRMKADVRPVGDDFVHTWTPLASDAPRSDSALLEKQLRQRAAKAWANYDAKKGFSDDAAAQERALTEQDLPFQLKLAGKVRKGTLSFTFDAAIPGSPVFLTAHDTALIWKPVVSRLDSPDQVNLFRRATVRLGDAVTDSADLLAGLKGLQQAKSALEKCAQLRLV
jgi:hypothetical protein